MLFSGAGDYLTAIMSMCENSMPKRLVFLYSQLTDDDKINTVILAIPNVITVSLFYTVTKWGGDPA